jgi:hypothetical protein
MHAKFVAHLLISIAIRHWNGNELGKSDLENLLFCSIVLNFCFVTFLAFLLSIWKHPLVQQYPRTIAAALGLLFVGSIFFFVFLGTIATEPSRALVFGLVSLFTLLPGAYVSLYIYRAIMVQSWCFLSLDVCACYKSVMIYP